MIPIHIKKQIYTEVGYMQSKEDYVMKINWGMMGVILCSLLFWCSVFYFGLFQTIAWTIIVSAVIGLMIKLKENV